MQFERLGEGAVYLSMHIESLVILIDCTKDLFELIGSICMRWFGLNVSLHKPFIFDFCITIQLLI